MTSSDHQVTAAFVGTNRLIEKSDWETKRPAVIKSPYRLSQSLQNDTPPHSSPFWPSHFLTSHFNIRNVLSRLFYSDNRRRFKANQRLTIYTL